MLDRVARRSTGRAAAVGLRWPTEPLWCGRRGRRAGQSGVRRMRNTGSGTDWGAAPWLSAAPGPCPQSARADSHRRGELLPIEVANGRKGGAKVHEGRKGVEQA